MIPSQPECFKIILNLARVGLKLRALGWNEMNGKKGLQWGGVEWEL